MNLIEMTKADLVWTSRIIEASAPICGYIIEHEPGQECGVMCIADSTTGLPIFVCIYGFTTRTPELDECIAFAQEKAARLASRPSDWSSWQSRDMTTDPKQYGGAIRVNRLILSFSGFKEEQDEAAMLVLALNTELIDRGIAARFVEMSNNEYFRKLQDACGKNMRSANPLDRYQFADEKHP